MECPKCEEEREILSVKTDEFRIYRCRYCGWTWRKYFIGQTGLGLWE